MFQPPVMHAPLPPSLPKFAAPPDGCTPRLVGFDFEAKREYELSLEQFEAALDTGSFVWIDLEFSLIEAARKLLTALGRLEPQTIEDALTREPTTQLARYEGYLHFALSGCRLVGDRFELTRVDCVIGDCFMITIHRGPVSFVESMRRSYHHDFARFARTPSFLVYELWDTLIESYLAVQRALESQVAALQAQLMGHSEDDAVFMRVAKLGGDLLDFRKVVLLGRAALNDLGTRRSLFVSETTQGFLLNLVGTLEHVLQELLVDRDVLSESLNLHMSLVTHRTNLVMKKLTVVSVVFLPLTFLCGVYGMNFHYLPELEWRQGYALFWLLVVLIVLLIAWLSRRARLW